MMVPPVVPADDLSATSSRAPIGEEDAAPRGVVRSGESRNRVEARWRRTSVQELLSPFLPLQAVADGSAASGTGGRGGATPSARVPLVLPPTRAASSSWDGMRTIELRDEERQHAQEENSVATGRRGWWWWQLQGWILAIGVGIASSVSGWLIEMAVNNLASVRFGWCRSDYLSIRSSCPSNDWERWDDGLLGFTLNIGIGTAFAAASGLMVYLFAPAASGSGIPEVKTILNGFVMPDVVSLRTLCVKIPGLALSVSAGMALGKEGPLVHIAVCWAQLMSGIFPQFQNEAKRRELFSAAAAAGVSTAFGAPLGGVLFSLEEVSSQFPTKTLIRAFTAAVSAALTLSMLKRSAHGLTMFSVEYNTPVEPVENIAFALLGVLGGLIGAAFNAVNVKWSAFRMTPGFAKRINGPLQVTLIAFVTVVSSWPMLFTRMLSTEVIHSMFASCSPGSGSQLRVFIGLCTEDGDYAPADTGLLLTLAGASMLRLAQTTLTFGTACPAGLFVPSLFTGACLGRCVGVAVRALNQHHHFLSKEVEPGVYAMVGAAAVLGGVCRVTISLVAIMLELTGGMTYIVPFMLAVLVAKIVGDALNEGIYDLYIVLRGYPFLQEELNVTFDERCCDIMETRLTTLDVSLEPRLLDIRALLQAYEYRGFPVVNAGHFIGYAKRHPLQAMLDELLAGPVARDAGDLVTLQDLLPYTDCDVMRMVPDASLSQVHKAFKQLGCKSIFLVGSSGHRPTQDVLQGMLTKKKFLLALKSGRVGHMAEPQILGPSLAASLAASSVQRRRLSVPDSVERYLQRHGSSIGSPMESPRGRTEGSGDSLEGASEEGGSLASEMVMTGSRLAQLQEGSSPAV